MRLTLEVKLLSPLHLGSGKGDVVVDAEIVHDERGIPYFPAKRIKGLLYESALEILEMGKLSGVALVEEAAVEELFGKRESKTELYIHDLTLPDYMELKTAWTYLLDKYNNILSSADVLDSYTSLRYQTAIDKETGIAANSSLHNMRVMDSGHSFKGELEIFGAEPKHIKALVLAAANLRYAGAKRNRGFGEITCSLAGLPAEYTLEKFIGGK